MKTVENIATVCDSVCENSRQSIRRRAQELGLSQSSTWIILHRDLMLHPYKIQLTQDFNKTALRAILHAQRWIYWTRSLKTLSYRVAATSIGLRDRAI